LYSARGAIGESSKDGVIRKEAQRLIVAWLGILAAQHQRILRGQPNGHLHLALGAAFLSCSILALAVPVPGSGVSNSPPRSISDSLSTTSGWVASRDDLANLDPGPALQIRTEPVAFTLHENGLTTSHETTGATVADALGEAGVTLNKADFVVPSADVPLRAGAHVYVRYAQRVSVRSGGREADIFTQAATVGEALLGSDLDLQPTDTVIPERSTRVSSGMVVGLTTIRDGRVAHDTPIAHETVYSYDGNLSNGTRVVTQPGADGYVRKEYMVKQINGLEVTRQPLGESTVHPTPEIVSIGTKESAVSAPEPNISFGAGTAPDGSQCTQTVTVWSTYYTAASAGGTRTATGTGVYKGIVAVDPRYIPLGTRMYIPGYGYGLAADTGGGVKGWWLDVAYGENDVYDWYSHYVDICLLP
jgi:3D (Asp-Asp-Asp) domain-containing protein